MFIIQEHTLLGVQVEEAPLPGPLRLDGVLGGEAGAAAMIGTRRGFAECDIPIKEARWPGRRQEGLIFKTPSPPRRY